MTPKEKARKLVDKYLNQSINFLYIDTQDGQCVGTGDMTYVSAKICAIIAVEEILHLINEMDWQDDRKTYWETVKIEIEKL